MLTRQNNLFVASGVIAIFTYAISVWFDTSLFFGVGLFIVGGILAVQWWDRPRYLLLALALYLPFQDGLIFYLSDKGSALRILPDVLLLAAFGLSLVQSRIRHEKFFGKGIEYPLIFLFAISILSMLINHIPVKDAVQGPYTMFRYSMVFYLVANSLFQLDEVRFFLRVLAGLAVVQCLIGLIQYANLHLGNSVMLFTGSAVQGTHSQWNIYGVFLAMTAVILWATFDFIQVAQSEINKNLIIGLTLCMILIATSRQSIVAFLLGIAFIFFLARRQIGFPFLGRTLAFAAVGLVIGFIALKAPYTPSAIQLITSHGGGTTPDTTSVTKIQSTTHVSDYLQPSFYVNARFYAIRYAGQVILKEKPLFGFGPGTYGSQPTFAVTPKNVQFYTHLNVPLLLSAKGSVLVADVEWMNVFGQLGLLGIAGFLWLFFCFGRIGYTIWKTSTDALTQRLGLLSIAFVPMFIFLGIFGPNFEIRQISIFLWLIPALGLSLLKQQQQVPTTAPQVDSTTSPQLDETQKRENIKQFSYR